MTHRRLLLRQRARLIASRLGGALLLSAALHGLGAGQAHAGQFSVHPLRLEISPTHTRDAIVVRNEDDATLSFQVKGVRWRQDADGQEHYDEAPGLVYFPRLLTLPPGQSAVVRIGLRQPASEVEQTYRVFIEELAPATSHEGPGARIRVLVRFGAPVFVRPTQVRHQLALTGFGLESGQARWAVHNQGTRHEYFKAITLRGLDAAGSEVFQQDLLAERYVLAGGTRRFLAPLPPDLCGRLARLALTITTDQSEIRRDLDVSATPCP